MAEDLYINAVSKTEKYRALLPQLKNLLAGEDDLIANLANVSAALKETFHFFWVGFYLVKGEELVLGPFQGPIACTRIRKGRGVCGTAWDKDETLVVPDVDAFPGHIACSSLSRSEIVVPLKREDGEVWGVLDIDSDDLGDYCFCPAALRPGLWSSTVTLKKAFKDEQDAIAVFKKELSKNLQALRVAGLFFSFTTDPLLPETMELTVQGVKTCVENGVNVKVLTKRADFMDNFFGLLASYGNFDEDQYREHTAFGFTLTGHDELERGASSNIERIGAMEELHNRGYRIFASIEPIVDFPSSMQMINGSLPFCDLYKIGLMSGNGVTYDPIEAQTFLSELQQFPGQPKIYLKNSLIRLLGVDRKTLPENFVESNYNMFG